MKVCTLCGVEKEPSEFNKVRRTKDGLDCWCRACKSIKDKQYRQKNKDKVAEAAKWKHKKVTYGVTKEQFLELLDKQNAKCLICFEDIQENPHIDHNHNNGEVRGLLCKPCNRGLGFFRDSPAHLKNAYQYLIEKGHYGQQNA